MAIWDDTKLFDRILQLKSQREKGYVKFNSARDSIVELMRPDLGSDTTPDGDGTFFGQDIYDGVGPWSVGVMARGFQGGLVTADADWFEHDMADPILDEVDALSIWLQEADDHLTAVFRESNFYKVLPTFTKDGVSIGSPVMFIEETDVVKGEISFLPQHYKTVLLFYDKNNRPDGIIITDKTWTVKQISDQFAPSEIEQKEKLSVSINNQIENGHYYKEHTIIRAVFKGTNPVWDVDEFKKPDAEWVSVYFEEDTAEDRKNDPLSTEQYFSRPFVQWDYDKKPEESVSRTPAFDAVYDVLSQNEESLDLATNRKLKNNPARAVLADHRNIVDFNPEGITPVEKADWNFLPKAIDVVGDIRTTRENLEFGAEKVKRWFHTVDFIKFTDLTNTLKQQPSATQIIKIAAELATQVNPGIATYTDFLSDVDDRILDIEIRAGRGPFAPERMQEISEIIRNILGEASEITVTPIFIGPLARAQKVKQELDPILEGLGVADSMMERQPDLIHAVRWHGTLERIFKATGFPLAEFVPEDEYNKIIAIVRQAEADALATQQRIELMKASKNLQGPVDESSVLATAAEG